MSLLLVFLRESTVKSLMFVGRGNLEDEKVKKEYERGYKVLLEFFHQHL